jgi:hypothetical protein
VNKRKSSLDGGESGGGGSGGGVDPSKKAKATPAPTGTAATDAGVSSNVAGSSESATTASAKKKPVDTSSHKRHHHMTTERAAKMDALLEELKADATAASTNMKHRRNDGSESPLHMHDDGFVPNKKGSFVTGAEEEYTTTNIFVGNLDPTVSEEMLTDLFRQFGEIAVLPCIPLATFGFLP